jgi:uncharacterized protein (TIGR00255 family)
MIRSMTGFGRGSAGNAGLRVTVEMRSVNHRFADLRLRLPDGLASLEADLRKRVLDRIRRGRVEVDVRLDRTGSAASAALLNRPLVEGILAAARTLHDEFGVEGRVDVASVLTAPGVLEWGWGKTPLDEDGRRFVMEAVDAALSAVEDERAREGGTLREDLERRLGRMRSLVTEIAGLATRVPETLQRRLADRLKALAGTIEIDPGRIAQEAAFLAERTDVTEELVRLGAHIEQAVSLLRLADGEPAGKRLDFLLQEIHRETNTITSKSQDLEISRRALDLKAETEKVREQIQNLE